MEVAQIYPLVNQALAEALGKEEVLARDLSNVVDLGAEVFNARAMDKYVGSLVNQIGRVIFDNRVYKGSVPSVLMEGWEYGSVLEKIRCDIPEATENESWELVDGASYDQNIFYQPKVTAKFYNSKTTFEVPMSFTSKQVMQSFQNATQLNAFLSMLFTSVENSLTVALDNLVMNTIDSMIAETVYSEYQGAALNTKSGVRAVNLLKLYNTEFSKTLTAAQAITDADFIRYASVHMALYVKRLGKLSTLFNVGGRPKFTSEDYLHIVLLDVFQKKAGAYLNASTYHDEYIKLPNAETVAYWQGSGKAYAFEDVSKINVKTASNNTVEVTGILGIMFDRYALGVTNLDKRVTTHYNAKAEFYTNYYKNDAGFFNDLNENFVVFFIA